MSPVATPGHQRVSGRLYSALLAAAEADIPWYLLVEQESEAVLLRLFRLDGDHFTEHGAGAPGSPLTMDEPVTVTLDPAGLLPGRSR